MKHHYADLLDRSSGYWTITPNRERWSCHFSDLAEAPEDVSRLTITRNDKNWERTKNFKQLVELTLHEPDHAQLAALADFPKLTALRISHARPKTLAMLESHTALLELVLEYVSGISDLEPLGGLPSLTSLHLENLRRVSDFSSLGSSDWNQPIESFDFLGSMKSLEFLKLCWVRVPRGPFLFTSLLELKELSRLEIAMGELPLEEFAWLAAKLPHIEGAAMPPFAQYGGEARPIDPDDHRAKMPLKEFQRYSGLYIGEDGKRYENVPHEAFLLGKGQRMVSGAADHVTEKCAAHEAKYRGLVDMYRNS
jgi:hypothetical protein